MNTKFLPLIVVICTSINHTIQSASYSAHASPPRYPVLYATLNQLPKPRLNVSTSSSLSSSYDPDQDDMSAADEASPVTSSDSESPKTSTSSDSISSLASSEPIVTSSHTPQNSPLNSAGLTLNTHMPTPSINIPNARQNNAQKELEIAARIAQERNDAIRSWEEYAKKNNIKAPIKSPLTQAETVIKHFFDHDPLTCTGLCKHIIIKTPQEIARTKAEAARNGIPQASLNIISFSMPS